MDYERYDAYLGIGIIVAMIIGYLIFFGFFV